MLTQTLDQVLTFARTLEGAIRIALWLRVKRAMQLSIVSGLKQFQGKTNRESEVE